MRFDFSLLRNQDDAGGGAAAEEIAFMDDIRPGGPNLQKVRRVIVRLCKLYFQQQEGAKKPVFTGPIPEIQIDSIKTGANNEAARKAIARLIMQEQGKR